MSQETEEDFAGRFVSLDGFNVTEALDRIKSRCPALPPELGQVVSTFVEALKRTEKVATIPCNLAWLGVADVAENAFFHRATITALDQLDPFKDDLEVEVPKLRAQLARREFTEFLESSEGRHQLRAGALGFLQRGAQLSQLQLLASAEHLLLQCAISIWAALEAFSFDFVRTLINLDARRVTKLLADEECKKRIGKTKWTLDQLLELGFDLSSRVGDLVLSENDLSDLASMKAVLLTLFERPSRLVDALEDDAVYLLGKSRHLLVHRAGHVDGKFERETASRWKAGTALTISANELTVYARAVVAVAEATVDAFSGGGHA